MLIAHHIPKLARLRLVLILMDLIQHRILLQIRPAVECQWEVYLFFSDFRVVGKLIHNRVCPRMVRHRLDGHIVRLVLIYSLDLA